ncbi:MAG TPA: hypothetical protein ENJ95_03540 [Bacteroidetes bacterium]|nr:hypothetical protein [Bacteroidota bacterium]
MKNLTTTSATITRIGKSVPSKFPNRPNRKAVTFSADGREIEIWVDDIGTVAALTIGTVCTLVFDGKGYSIADFSPAPTAAPFQPAPPLPTAPAGTAGSCERFKTPTKGERVNMMKYIEFEGKLYRHCYDVAATNMEDMNLKDEVLKDVATSLFIGAMRFYNLQ